MVLLHLPNSKSVDTLALEWTYRHTTNSYKFLFLIAILDILERESYSTPRMSLSLDDIASEMLILAWYPHVELKLSLGIQDKLGSIVDAVRTLADANSRGRVERYIREGVRIEYPLERYVPYRLLRGFFNEELRGVADNKVNALIKKLSFREFTDRKPIYHFEKGGHIIFHPDWAAYFQENTVSIRKWITNQFVQYLNAKNPHVPGICGLIQPLGFRDRTHSQNKAYIQAKEIINSKYNWGHVAECSFDDEKLVGFIELLWRSYSPA